MPRCPRCNVRGRKAKAPRKGRFAQTDEVLDSADFDRVRALRAFCDLKADLVAFAEFVELYVDELVGVEKEIFFATFDFDEPETLIGETGNCSFLHGNEK